MRCFLCNLLHLCLAGHSLASVATDKFLKLYSVQDFGKLTQDCSTVLLRNSHTCSPIPSPDMTQMIQLDFAPSACCWVHEPTATKGVVAVASSENGDIKLFRAESEHEAFATLKLHQAPVIMMKYCSKYCSLYPA